MNSNLLDKAVRYALAAGALLAVAAPAVLAQDAAQNTPAAQSAQSEKEKNVKLGRIMVTGSAIPRTSIETPAPVTVITAKEIKQSGLTTVADVIRSIAADNSGTIPTAFTLGFAAGSSGVALRGLTVNSTLVLIDGHRTAAYALADDGERSFTDLNSIPLNAVERIEVLKDGASSIYGADAIAGVVNIILYKTYRGTQVTAEAGTSQHGGGAMTRATVITGTGDLNQDNYNAYVSFEYENDNPIFSHTRGFPFNTADLSSIGGLDFNAGNPNLQSGSIYGTVAPATVTNGNILTGQATGPFQPLRACGPNSTPVTVPGTGPGTGSYCEQNFVSLYGQAAPQTTRYGLDGRVTFRINDANQAYVNAFYDQFRLVTQGAPAQIQTTVPNNTTNIALPPILLNGQINPNDPFANPTCAANKNCPYALINYAFGDLQNRTVLVNHNLRVVADVNGALNDKWNYDTAVTLNHTWLNSNYYGFLDYPQLINDIQTGAYSFINPASNSQAVLQALSPVIAKTSTTDLGEFDFGVNGELGSLPGGPLGLAAGVQWRYEAQDDPDLNPNDAFQGLGVAHTIGFRNVSAVYGEVDMPLLQSLEVDVSAREDHYSDVGSAFSPKAGFKWTPSSMFALRGTYSRGFRAPSFAENGSSSSEGFITYTPPASFAALHGNDGYVQPYALGLLTAANPNIKPERARNYTIGVVFQPLASFSGTLDYYNIVKTGVIGPSSPDVALNAYYAGQPLPPGYSITPDLPDPNFPSALPRPVIVAAPYINQNELRTSGADIGLRYNHAFGNGLDWVSDLEGTKIITFKETLGQGGPFVSFVGTQGPYILSSGAGTPQYRANWSNSFTFGPANITATLYYVSGLYMSVPDVTGPGTENLCFSTATPTGANLPPDCRMPSFTYVDLTGSYSISSHLQLTAGILNAFDRKAPFDPIDYAGVNYNPTYDYAGIVGRFYQVGLKATF